MLKSIILSSLLSVSIVSAEGYYCPYSDLGYDGTNDLLYDYYEGHGDYWTRMGTTGWETRLAYCNAKGDLSIHSDAGQAKCEDSQGTCYWTGSSCEPDNNKQPDCYALCQTIKNGGGLECLGNCPGGNKDRSQIYAICDGTPTPTTTDTTTTDTTPTTTDTTTTPSGGTPRVCNRK